MPSTKTGCSRPRRTCSSTETRSHLLYRYIQKHKLNVLIDSADVGWGSPLGNSLERGGGRTPMREHWDAVCGLEVVLANGEILRTGMGTCPCRCTTTSCRC